MPTVAETFEDIILHQTARELVPFLLSIDKKDAIALRRPTQQLKKRLEEYRQVEGKKGRIEYQRLLTTEQQAMLALTGLATFTRKEALARSFELPWSLRNSHDNRQHYDLHWQVLRHFRPDWLGDLLARMTRTNLWQAPDYAELRALEREGLIAFDPPTFAQLLGNRLSRYDREDKRKRTQQQVEEVILTDLRADPELLGRDVWLLFDYETNVNYDSTYIGSYPNGISIGWIALLVALATTGDLDRSELLTRSLLALRRDFKRPLLGWFKELFAGLKPTLEERLARQNELVELLAHPLPVVVNFAIEQLKGLWENPGFDLGPLLQYADGLMSRQDLKTGLKTLLTSFEKLLKSQPAQAPALTRLAAAALPHADAGVQDRAARVLAAVLTAKTPLLSPAEIQETTTTLSAYADLLSPAARTRLAPWLTASAAQEQDAAAPAADYSPQAGFVPELTPDTALAPVADWHELLFLTGPVLAADDPTAVDRWVDGLLRLRPHLPADHATQLRPYQKQVLSWHGQERTPAEQEALLQTYHTTGRPGPYDLLAALVVGLATGFENPHVARLDLRKSHYHAADPLLQLEQRRLAAAEGRLRPGAVPLPLLSTATHAPHWVAPSILVDKLLTYQEANETPDAADLAVALARCAWSNPADAQQARARLPELHAADLRELLNWLLASCEEEAPAVAATPETLSAGADPQTEQVKNYGANSTRTTTPLGPVPVPVPAPAPPHATKLPSWPEADSAADPSLLERAREKLGKLIPIKSQPEQILPLDLTEALPWLWAVAARTRYPTAELPALAALGKLPGLALPWEPGWTLAEITLTYVRKWEKGQPTVTDKHVELLVPDTPASRPAPPLFPYTAYAGLTQRVEQSGYVLRFSISSSLALLPNNPEPLHWHVLRTCCRTDEAGSEARDAVQLALKGLLGIGPPHATGTSSLLAAGLLHQAPVVRAMGLEVLLSATDTGRLVPADLGRALGRLLAAGRAPLARLAEGLGQARAISRRTDDALRQILEALLPLLPAVPLRNTAKVLDAYADALSRVRRLVPESVQERLREWQRVSSLKKAAGALLQEKGSAVSLHVGHQQA
ncbi:DUF6493 family protein [Hymenobacter sp. J193]|uniref:DUF6493 family protein n=1 Tax=Hymenobacter sp. J193 TaxID=2898429 RepID=UPI002151E82D|nr:DUF6493 family protein [Hymenobacter sp. J193]MCR5890006.1 DUF6493 family protein [Hymenobacter sp. J193]